MEQSDVVDIDDFLSEILPLCDDERYRNGFTRGWYISGIQRCLDELGFETFFAYQTTDIDLNKESLQLPVPCNMFNIREMYLFNGECTPETYVIVYWKKQFNNGKGGDKYTAARNNGNFNMIDPFYPQSFIGDNVYYANIQNGTIMLGANSRGYDKIRIVGNVAGSTIGNKFEVPRFFRQVIVDFVCERYFRAKIAKGDRTAISLQRLYDDNLYSFKPDKAGSWKTAKARIAEMSSWKKNSLQQSLYGQKGWNS